MEKRTYENLKYQHGYENHFETEAVAGSLPVGRNSPQKCAHGLYAEQISGTSFTQPRRNNFKTWYYRIQPSVTHKPFKPCAGDKFKYIDNKFSDPNHFIVDPNQHRWRPLELPGEKDSITWIEGLVTHIGIGCPLSKSGFASYQYRCNKSMGHTAFYDSDGDLLIVPQVGTLHITTENGKLTVPPRQIAVIPRGIKFSVDVTEASRGYVAEVFDGHFVLPDLGPIGANGLAANRDFEAPVAAFEEYKGEFTVGGMS